MTEVGGNIKQVLKGFVERAQSVRADQKALSDDMRDLYAEAKGQGLDVKALKTVIRLLGQDPDELREHEAIVDTYMHALGKL